MEKVFVAYLVDNGNIIDKDGYDIIVKEIGDNRYQELITGNIFENYRYSNNKVSICLCFRIDSVLHYKYISNYLTSKNKKNSEGKLEIKKFCPRCNKTTVHKEKKA